MLSVALVVSCKSATSDTRVKGNESGGDAAMASVDAPVGTPMAGKSLFNDPAVPHCQPGTSIFQLKGQLAGETIDIGRLLLSDLEVGSFVVLEVVAGQVRTDLALTWSGPLAEDREIPLTGASLFVLEGQPLAGKSYCITKGLFGSPALKSGDPGRTVLFQITGARETDCHGPEVPVALGGCAFRTNTYFPVPGPDGGRLHFTTDAKPPVLDPAQTVASLTQQQKGDLCDWAIGAWGGYGVSTDCTGEGPYPVVNVSDQESCIKSYIDRACPDVTVKEFEDCIYAGVPKRGCVDVIECKRLYNRC